MILEEIKSIKSDKPELKKFGITIGIVLLALGLVFYIYGNAASPSFVVAGVVIISAGLLFPAVLLPLQKAWMVLAVLLGFVMTRVILSVLFFLIFTPMNFIARLFGKRFLDLKIDKGATSYWNIRERKPHEKIETERQF